MGSKLFTASSIATRQRTVRQGITRWRFVLVSTGPISFELSQDFVDGFAVIDVETLAAGNLKLA